MSGVLDGVPPDLPHPPPPQTNMFKYGLIKDDSGCVWVLRAVVSKGVVRQSLAIPRTSHSKVWREVHDGGMEDVDLLSFSI